MANPVVVDVPHTLGCAEAKRRLAGGIDRVFQYIPGGAHVSSSWPSESQMLLDVKALGQAASAVVDVEDKVVRITMALPPLLAMMGNKISDAVRRSSEQLLLR